MAEDPFDTPDRRRSSGGGGSRARYLWLAAGIAVGVAATLLVPRYLGPYLPGVFGTTHVRVEGQVLKKAVGDERLLLTLESERGAMLATFREKVSELDLLIGEGDIVTLAVEEYRPFVDRPVLLGVKKGKWPAPGAATGSDTAAGAAGAEPADGAAGGAGAAPEGTGTSPDATGAADTLRPGTGGGAAPDTAGVSGS